MVCRGGGVAQLGERLLCKQEVIGSIPFTSTILRRAHGALCRMFSEARGAKEDGCEGRFSGRTASKWIGRSKIFVGQQRLAFAIFDIVKSGVTEEASADACCLTCRQKSTSGMPKKHRSTRRSLTCWTVSLFGRVSSCETCLPCGALSCKR